MKRLLVWMLIIAMLLPVVAVHGQDSECGTALPTRLTGERHGLVPDGQTAPVYDSPGGNKVGDLQASGDPIFLSGGPQCSDNVWWWNISAGEFYDHWVPESVGGDYVLEPYRFTPAPPVALGVPMTEPLISNPEVPLPVISPAGNPRLTASVIWWDWAAFTENAWYTPPDPMFLQLPDAYAGDLPVPPVNLDTVRFVQDANLNAEQLALLAQNGFVVVPGGVPQFDAVYRGESWSHEDGKGDFITTDALLHTLFLSYQNALMFLETNKFYGQVANFVGGGYQAAEVQWREAAGTTLETPAQNAAVYYAVALLLLADGESSYLVGYDQTSGFQDGDLIPSQVLAQADPAILELAQPMVDMARAAEGRLEVPILENYEEDFSQYKPRSYYAGNPLLESYFRSMMWLGRITFRAKSEADTLSGLMVLRALVNSPGGYQDWSDMSAVLNFLVGPTDDYSPRDYLPLLELEYGPALPLDALADLTLLDRFLYDVEGLPEPRINSIPLPAGIQADEVADFTRGFRLFGQRFTLDGYIMQQLIYPEVGTSEMARALPLGLDIAAALGSDDAYVLADKAGATAFEGYTDHLFALRAEGNSMDGNAWLENLYGGWLWALQPLLVRDPAIVPPMMQTDAWRYKDIHTTLGSWTELKHATLLYAEQPMGGLGGGGTEPPVISTSYVEPNPLVFARIAIVAATLDQGLAERGYYEETWSTSLGSVNNALQSLTILSAQLAEISRKEIAGEPISYEELYWMQESFDGQLWYIRYTLEEWVTDPPETVALVADVASNATAGTVLEEAIGPVDYIYVIANGPHGLHLTRGGVYSYYEFVQPIDQRLTDAEWQELLAAGNAPPRPDWIDIFFSE